VVTDIQMPPDHSDDGLRAAGEIRSIEPRVGVLVLSQFLEDRYALELFADGADGVGYLLKERVGDVPSFIGAVRRVAHGGSTRRLTEGSSSAQPPALLRKTNRHGSDGKQEGVAGFADEAQAVPWRWTRPSRSDFALP
jgi:DNA-binding NarL/FixJ family response regulator